MTNLKSVTRNTKRVGIFILTFGLLAVPQNSLALEPQNQLSLISVNNNGLQGTHPQGTADSSLPSISGDGRYVAFMSYAVDLVPNDTNNRHDIFMRDIQAGSTSRVSITNTGQEGDGTSVTPVISSNGRFVVFGSSSSNLVPDDTNNTFDIFVKDLQTGLLTRENTSSNGQQANNNSNGAVYDISADGRYLAFSSLADNLVPNDNNGQSDIFLKDRITGITSRESTSSSGLQANNPSREPSISKDGRYIVYLSYASNLINNDSNNNCDVYVRDRLTGTTNRVSIANTDGQGNGCSSEPSISGDGSKVVFKSSATNLVAQPITIPADFPDMNNIYLRNLTDNTTTLISMGANGQSGDSYSDYAKISENGRFITYTSLANNLIDSNNSVVRNSNIFLWDSLTGKNKQINNSYNGALVNEGSYNSAPSADGALIAFMSYASNLVPNDLGRAADIFVYKQALDAVNPTVIGIPDRSPNAAGWYKADVTIDWHSTDPAPSSGAPTDPPNTVASSEGVAVSYTSNPSCDPAGNCATGSISLSIDKTNPTITAVASPNPNSNGWNNSNVTISFTCSDSLSGIATCPSPVTVSSEGDNQTITGTVTDMAGNSSTISKTLRVDKTKPLVNSLTLTPSVSLFFQPVSISAGVSDALSGVDNIQSGEYFIDTDPGVGNAIPMTYSNGNLAATISSNPGGLVLTPHTVSVRTKDKAGNWSTLRSAQFVVVLL